MKTYWEIDDGTDVVTRYSQDDVFDTIEAMAAERSLWGGAWVEGTDVLGDCDQERCDVCDGHLIGWVRKYVEA